MSSIDLVSSLTRHDYPSAFIINCYFVRLYVCVCMLCMRIFITFPSNFFVSVLRCNYHIVIHPARMTFMLLTFSVLLLSFDA